MNEREYDEHMRKLVHTDEGEFFRQTYIRSWHEAEAMGGDFRDCLLHRLVTNLGITVPEPPARDGYTDGGVVEMGGAPRADDQANEAGKGEER